MKTLLGFPVSPEQHYSVIKPEEWRDKIEDLLKALDTLAAE
ncbi:MAG: hypothetical protein U0587_21850 [Candidatus Binatia bacterium]